MKLKRFLDMILLVFVYVAEKDYNLKKKKFMPT